MKGFAYPEICKKSDGFPFLRSALRAAGNRAGALQPRSFFLQENRHSLFLKTLGVKKFQSGFGLPPDFRPHGRHLRQADSQTLCLPRRQATGNRIPNPRYRQKAENGWNSVSFRLFLATSTLLISGRKPRLFWGNFRLCAVLTAGVGIHPTSEKKPTQGQQRACFCLDFHVQSPCCKFGVTSATEQKNPAAPMLFRISVSAAFQRQSRYSFSFFSYTATAVHRKCFTCRKAKKVKRCKDFSHPATLVTHYLQ